MTDYLYGLSLAVQTRSFLLSLGFGFIMGIAYDAVRIVRITLSSKKLLVVISDIIFSFVFCFSFFIFLMTVNEGQFRFYLLLGSITGFFIYYFSLGAVVFALSQRLSELVKTCVKRIFYVLAYPFCQIFRRLRRAVGGKIKKSQKTLKKSENKLKYHLKLNKHLLYNLNVKKRFRVNGVSGKDKE